MNLITRDNNKLWSKSKKNLLLGNWCIDNIHRYKKNNKKNYLISKYHWNNKIKLRKDIKYLNGVYNKLLNNLCLNLNEYHGTKYPKRYWEILLYKWLWFYLVFIFDRWEMVRLVKKNKKLSVKILEYDKKSFIPSNTFEWSSLMKDSSYWNDWIFGEIIKFIGGIKYKFLNKIKIKPKFSFAKTRHRNNSDNYLPSMISNFLSSKKIFAQNSYFSKRLSLVFNLFYRQFRRLKIFGNNLNADINLLTRMQLIKLKKKNDLFTTFAYNLIKYHLPKVYWEEYRKINEIIINSNLPKKPKFIITSLDHNYNDAFKIYTATKVLCGSKLYIIQHGGFYGISDLNPDEKFEIKISDKFLTWGWKINNKTVPLFLQKTAKQNVNKKDNPEGLLISVYDFLLFPGAVRDGYPRNKEQVNKYIDSIVLFLSKINKNVLNISSIKNFNNERCKYISKSLKFKFPKLNLINSSKSTYLLSGKFRLIIETINSTGFLEALNLNIPVLLIYDKTFCSVRKSAVKEFNMLKKMKIIHASPEEAAKFVNQNYNQLDKWWNDQDLQKVRKIFCSKFARSTDYPLKDLQKILNINK